VNQCAQLGGTCTKCAHKGDQTCKSKLPNCKIKLYMQLWRIVEMQFVNISDLQTTIARYFFSFEFILEFLHNVMCVLTACKLHE